MLNRIKFAFQGRSSDWFNVRKIHLEWFPACAACSSRDKLEVHHVVPFALDRNLELDENNLITLCTHCHLVIGHLRDYKIYNANVKRDAKEFLFKRQAAYARSKYEASGNRSGKNGGNS
jgi:5-methylcytosine-specific restriction endonuclease McrA